MTLKHLKQNPIQCQGHTRPVVDLKFSDITGNGAYYLITASKDLTPMLRFGHTGDWIGTFKGHKGAVWTCSLIKDGTLAATGAADFTAKIWDCNTGVNTKTIAHDHIVRSVEFNDAANILVTANNKWEIALYDVDGTNNKLAKFTGHTDIIRKAIWLENDKIIISVSQDKTIRLWDIRENKELHKEVLPSKIYDVNLVDNQIILATDDGISLWTYKPDADSSPLHHIKSVKMNSQTYSASLLPNIARENTQDNFYVCGFENSLVNKYNLDDDSLIDSCKSHFGPVHCVRYSPDGHVFASGSEDGTIRLWQNNIGENYGLWYLTNNKLSSSTNNQ